MNQSIKIGILGSGSRSTIYFIDRLNKLYSNKKGGYSTCPFTLYNIDFNNLNPFLPDQYEKIEKHLLSYFNQIEKLEITHLVIPNITLHEHTDVILKKYNFNFRIIHPIKETLKKVKENKIKSVTLFGSLYSMRSNYIADHFTSQGIAVKRIPREEEIFLDELRVKIYNENEEEKDYGKFNLLIKDHTPVLVCCSELSVPKIVHNNSEVYDMIDLMVEKIINLVL